MFDISVITPTCRLDKLRLVEKALKRQTMEHEWIVIAPSNIKIKGFDIDILLSDPPKQKGDYWTVYKAYNKAIGKASGELIISWQDYTFAKPNTFEKFWFHYQQDKKSIISGVGNKYQDDTWTVETWRDPRKRTDQGTFYPCFHNDIELNLASFPKKAFYEVGGFDEEMDKYSSLCGLDVLERLNIIGGWEFYLDQTIESYSLEHGRLPGWDKNTPFKGVWQQRREEYIANPILNYLK